MDADLEPTRMYSRRALIEVLALPSHQATPSPEVQGFS